ncbi:MAG: carbohydrate ABC transporter permease [Provencibacterium sp.]|jgi:putative aldouronate transport system permease protein|nr:carbohydrate ABC transporter permease [Provencibacterium sp.]
MGRAANPNAIKTSRFDKGFYFVVNLLLFLVLLITLYPIIYVVSSSFSSAKAVSMGQVILLPVEPSLEGYQAVFKNKDILTGYGNTILYTAVGTVLNVFLTLIAAFGLSRRELVGFKLLNFLFAFTMWFNGGMIPTYLLMKDLGLINSRWAMWVPGMIGVWNVIITRTYFQNSVPEELFESASLDGCGYFTYFSRVVMPLSGAIIAVIALFYGVGHWNAYFNAFLYLNNKELFPLQIILRDILIQNQLDSQMMLDATSSDVNMWMADLLKYSVIMVACVPVWCIYPFVQKFFVKGVMVGAIKG